MSYFQVYCIDFFVASCIDCRFLNRALASYLGLPGTLSLLLEAPASTTLLNNILLSTKPAASIDDDDDDQVRICLR